MGCALAGLNTGLARIQTLEAKEMRGERERGEEKARRAL